MDVVIVTPEGCHLKVQVCYFDTVLEIKRTIERYHGIPVAQQRLLVGEVGDVAMEDARDTDYYGIVEGSCIQLQVVGGATAAPDQQPTAPLPSCRVEGSQAPQQQRVSDAMMVKVWPRSSTREAVMWVSPHDDVGVLRRKLAEINDKMQLSDDYVFIFGQHIMDERCSFRRHGVKHGDVIDLFQHTD